MEGLRRRWLARYGNGRWMRVALQKTFALWERLGVHVVPRHYSQPIPDSRSLSDELWDPRPLPPGLRIDLDAQAALLDSFAERFRSEYEAFPSHAEDAYSLDSTMLIGVDASVLHCMVRHFGPSRIVEVGSGDSTRVSAAALARNHRDGSPGELIAIEPHPDPTLRAGIPGVTRLIQQPVQTVPRSVFTDLRANDVLFLDSSHVARVGSDVLFEIHDVLPRLAPGVVVHFHDIFLPDEYPRSWIQRNRWFWNEQYLLQAFLSFNDSFEILWSGAYFFRERGAELRAAMACATDTRRPGSFWIRRTR